MHLNDRLTEWFPLLPRPRPAARALTERVDEVARLSHAAAHGPDDERLVTAAEALNKAALILSDCGLADRAHQLCWRQFGLFYDHRPLASKAAKLALQPVVNVGRLHIRSGLADRAHQLFTDAFHAVRTSTPTVIDGHDVDLSELIDDNAAARRELVQFLWTVLLADGTRALTRAGRWAEALAQLEQHKGIGIRMLDGRQVAIITRILAGAYDEANDLLDASITPELWERAVAAYLTTLCLTHAGHYPRSAAATMVDRYIDLVQEGTPPVFACRLGLSVLDLAEATSQAIIAREITRQAITSADAYAAHDVLTHPTCVHDITAADRETLTGVIADAGLHRTAETPNSVLDQLMDTVASVEVDLEHELVRLAEAVNATPAEKPPSTSQLRVGSR